MLTDLDTSNQCVQKYEGLHWSTPQYEDMYAESPSACSAVLRVRCKKAGDIKYLEFAIFVRLWFGIYTMASRIRDTYDYIICG